ncbi:GHKL domain-containing protein [Staphylococcus croceilyticus]|uniref:GHKL domain-containing protein n=1 Tax=Staphylococcus croceilyticus TaxID=319942 RepID=A0ABY2KCB4_9STAP|nr:GHKL domain-containing protein [Staphylococcus croceilyticus]PNZ70761.1 ATP-binding protein [Staphylococcus croceilyticus]TGA78888.1 GHKL domain-containing protein [Staphylococcus croceilyticus]
MTIINFVPLSIFQTIMLIWVAKIIIDIKFEKRDYLAILGIIIPSSILFYYFDRKSVLILIILCIIFFYTKVKLWSILAILMSTLVMYISNFFTVSLFYLLGNNLTLKFTLLVLYMISFSIIALICAYFIRFLVNRLKKTYLFFNNIYILIISLFLVFSIITLYLYTQKFYLDLEGLRLFAYVFIGILLFLTICIVIITYTTQRELRYKRNMEEIETYYEYTLQIESINNEMRKFRHDYVNILTTMSEYIREDDMTGLRAYFNENIVPMKDNLQMKSIKINGTENLKVRAIKGLVTTKILQAQEKNIPISIEVPELVEYIEMNTIDLSRIIGIIIDNAIEASEDLEDALIRIAFINTETSVMFIVMNKCKEDMPRIHELFQERFSTKGENRGLGLTTLKEITDSTENALLDTTIENGYFVQKVEIINNMS